MDKKKPEDCTVEELLADLTHWEEPDSDLMIRTTENGGVQVCEFDGSVWAEAGTLKEALVKFGKKWHLEWEHYYADELRSVDWLA